MNRLIASAWVIARRDFVATVWSKTFLLFLLAPIVAGAIGILIGKLTEDADIKASQPTIAVAMDRDNSDAVRAAHVRLAPAVGALSLPLLKYEEPAPNSAAQARRLLSSHEENVSAVLTGTIGQPTLTGPPSVLDGLQPDVTLLLDEARRNAALVSAGYQGGPVQIATVPTAESVESLNMIRHFLARGAQTIIFFLTLLLATMLLSNLVEEKSNKVIEVLAAAVPLDAVFLGKMIAMVGVALVGVALWSSIAGIGLLSFEDAISIPIKPAVGWPVFCILLIVYFTANYMLLGSVFLGVGAQASNVREVQTLSMPITFAQVLIFALASMAVGDEGGTMTWISAVFPLSSPLTMIALAARSPDLWTHLLALAWQIVWIAIIVRLAARLFRATVLKSKTDESFFAFLRRSRPGA